jgi:hypothetical protein
MFPVFLLVLFALTGLAVLLGYSADSRGSGPWYPGAGSRHD